MNINTETQADGTIKVSLEFTYDPKGEYPMSSTGNSRIVDSSGGWQMIDAKLGLKLDGKLIQVIPKGKRAPK